MLHICLIFILSHLLADFIFQSNNMSKNKERKIDWKGGKFESQRIDLSSDNNRLKFKSLFFHILMHFVVLILTIKVIFIIDKEYLIHDYQYIILMIFYVLLFHFIIDCFKYKLVNYCDFMFLKNKWNSKFKMLWIFILDQILHIVCIYLTVILVSEGTISNKLLSFLNSNLYINYDLEYLDKTLLILIIGLMGTYFAGYFINLYLKPNTPTFNISDESTTISIKLPLIKEITKKDEYFFEKKINSQISDNSSLSFGMSIGLIERTLIIVLVSTSTYVLVAIIIALKTLTRFKMIEQNKDFGEYYLIGNLLSLIFSISAGILIKLVLLY